MTALSHRPALFEKSVCPFTAWLLTPAAIAVSYFLVLFDCLAFITLLGPDHEMFTLNSAYDEKCFQARPPRPLLSSQTLCHTNFCLPVATVLQSCLRQF